MIAQRPDVARTGDRLGRGVRDGVGGIIIDGRAVVIGIVEQRVQFFLGDSDQAEVEILGQQAAFTRRLDRLSRQASRIERDLRISTETLGLFVRFWLMITPPIAPEDQAAAQIKGRERFEGFVDTLGKRIQKGQSFLQEIPDDVAPDPSKGEGEEPR